MIPLVGTKGAPGVAERIISEIPPHDVYVEPFWGRGTIARRMKPAPIIVGVDKDRDAIADALADNFLIFRGCGIEWLDGYTSGPGAPATLGGFPWSRHFIYIDPPYLGFNRYYKFGLSPEDHERLVKLFLEIGAMGINAAISCYDNELYNSILGDRCRRIEIETVARSGDRRVEVVFFNYAPPEQLHDSRFIGGDRRGRERVRRRVRNWAGGLAKMPPHERQAVFEACHEIMKGPENGRAPNDLE